jgi:hypothetical protein
MLTILRLTSQSPRLHRAIKKISQLILLSSLAVFFALPAFAAGKVTTVRGKSVALDFTATDAPPSVGDEFVLNIDGKNIGLIRITQVRGVRAIAQVVRGTARVEAEARPRSQSQASRPAGSTSRPRTRRNQGTALLFNSTTFGVMGGYGLDSQSVKTNGGTATMSGSGFAFKGFVDVPVADGLGAIGRLGIDTFNVTGNIGGSTKCKSNTEDCKTSIMYGAADLLLRYSFLTGAFRPFGHGGLSVLFPVSKSSNILDESKIAATTILLIGGGFSFAFSDSLYATAAAEYGYFPASNDVTTSTINLRAGMGMKF